MTTEENKRVVRRIYEEVINQENPAVVDEIVDPNVVIHDPMQGTLNGRDAFKQLLDVFNRAFPGHRALVHALIAEGDYVAVMHTHFGTHSGPFLHIPASDREFKVSGIEAARVMDGKIVEFWRQDDDLGLLMQLGAIPRSEAAA